MFNPKSRILLVEDMKTVRAFVADLLRGIGFLNVLPVDNVAEAWSQISNAQPPFELIVCDWDLAQGSGFDLLKRLRSDSRMKNIPFLMTALEAETDLVFSLEAAPFTHTILKPFSAAKLQKKIEELHQKSV